MSQVRTRRISTERAGLRRSASCRLSSLLATVSLLSAAVLAGCQAVDRPVPLPVSHSVRCEQLLVLSDVKLDKNHELIRELSNLREQESAVLELPLQRDPVVVYIFNNENDYRRYMAGAFPGLPPRSAYFVGSTTELAVYTHWGQNVREDLRHEYTHGLLHSAMKKVPLWLDEGLAEYFEVSGEHLGGLNHDYAERLNEALGKGWQPNMERLEGLNDSSLMKRAQYQESWAWVHFMLNTSPQAKRVLLSYLKDLRTKPDPRPLSKRLKTEVPGFEERFVKYVSGLQGSRQTAQAAPAGKTL